MEIKLTGTDVLVTIKETPRGFAVVITDVDSGETLPTAKIFPKLSDAMAFAHSCLS